MSLTQACTEVKASVARARSLFNAAATAPSAPSDLGTATTTAAAARNRMVAGDQSGAAVAAHQAVSARSSDLIGTASRSDAALAGHLTTAAAITRTGASQLDQIDRQVQTLSQRAPFARSAADQRVILAGLQAATSRTQQVVQSAERQLDGVAAQVRALPYPRDRPAGSPSSTDAQPMDNGPGTGKEPPHGQDPRYWIDVTKIKPIPTSGPNAGLMDSGYIEIAPGLQHPGPGGGDPIMPPPPPAKYPLGLEDIHPLPPAAPGQPRLRPYDTTDFGPDHYIPYPYGHDVPPPSWPAPKNPIDIRDIVKSPTAPGYGYREYLPGYWIPDPTLNGPR
ncbi:hypothetical protein [Mycolicibacterium llatzerense]|uniref:hypothetical protein n=1 Tax=Mycolicibacterium llatzerense TaxID=280871 RepID=UPI0008DD25AA|nr:hypothetical protein [Mycolicibacterium llatzerense]